MMYIEQEIGVGIIMVIAATGIALWVQQIIIKKYLTIKGIKKQKGRAHCKICDKIIDEKIYTLTDIKGYFCKYHAYIISKKGLKYVIEDSFDNIKKTTRQQPNDNNYVCFICNKHMPAYSDNTGSFCKWCRHRYCDKHTKPEEHGCPKTYDSKGKKLNKRSWMKQFNKNPGTCFSCSKKINDLTGDLCKYCDEWHCLEHIQPEKHNCDGNPKNPHGPAGRFTYNRYGTTYHTE